MLHKLQATGQSRGAETRVTFHEVSLRRDEESSCSGRFGAEVVFCVVKRHSGKCNGELIT